MMCRSGAAVLVATVSILLAACSGQKTAHNDLGPLETRHTGVGEILTNPKGMTLYTYKDDPANGSICYRRCARGWPPMVAAPGAKSNGKLKVIQRKDGIRQWAYNGKALYTWRKDKKPGDTTGHNKGDVWFVARP